MVRRDLVGVMVKLPEGKTYLFIGKNPDAARGHRDVYNHNHQREFPLIPAKLVHPPQFVVDAYVAAGNVLN